MEFIPSSIQNEDAPGADAEAEVMDRLKNAFSPGDHGVIYYRFPIKDRAGERFDKEPDFVLLTQELGLVVIEVKGYQIDHIESIEGQIWNLQNISQPRSQPYSQAREQAFFLQSHFLKEPSLRDDHGNSKIPVNFLVALPNITADEWASNRFADTPSVRVLTADDLTPQSLRTELRELPGEGLTQKEFQNARAALSGGEVISDKRGQSPSDAETKGELYEQVERGLKQLDRRQEEVGLQVPPGPQQIRGIAGSGKTVLLAMKAAAMHTTHPDWKIALTFNTRSLYDSIRSTVRRFTAHFSEGEPDWERLDVLHAWGGSSEHGLYYKIAQSAGVPANTVADAKRKFGNGSPAELLSQSCAELRNSANIQEEYDAILIDEAQDLEPPFYRMCYDALKEPKRLIWAYDEAQNLTSLSAPTPSSIFDTEEGGPEVDLSGSYKGGILKSQIMRRSYRSPRDITMTAHALGMGLKRPEGAVQAITQKAQWEDIGYRVLEGDFRETGEEVRITRPAKNSPHPLQDEEDARPFVRFEPFDEKDDELEYVTESIRCDIEEEGLDPEQIMVICLGSPNRARKTGTKLSQRLDDHSIKGNRVWKGNTSIFAREGEVTISGINRAKGNEAAMVYVLNLEKTEQSNWHNSTIQARNKAFVAITRSRAWCTITGTGEDVAIFDELDEIIDEATSENPIIEFPVPADENQGPYSDETMATTIDQFVDDINDAVTTVDVNCPVDECGFTGSAPLVSRHVTGTGDLNHDWSFLGYDGPAEFIEEHSE